MKKQNQKKLNLKSETTAKLSTVQLAQAQGGKWRYESVDECGTFGC